MIWTEIWTIPPKDAFLQTPGWAFYCPQPNEQIARQRASAQASRCALEPNIFGPVRVMKELPGGAPQLVCLYTGVT